MVRPRSSGKAQKQRGGAGQAKRKHGGAPSGGGGGRPAKQSRREGKSKPVDKDVFEAEDSDPDEVKHAERFDKVDNYEYELPSDFEDEEIDEDLAFTEEDKKKFGAWFEKEVSADEDEGAIIGDDDGEDWDDDEDEDDEDDDDGDGRGDRRGQHKGAGPDGDDDEDDLLFGSDDDLDAEDDDEDGSEEDEGMDYERHRAMLREVLEAADAGTSSRKRARRDPNAAVVSEAYPESEYNLNPGAASAGGPSSLSIADLLKGLAPEERRKLGSARRLLEKVGGVGGADDLEDEEGDGGGRRRGAKPMKPVSVPLPGVVAERQERKAGYEAASKDVSKWLPIVKANREAPTLRLVSGREEVPRVSTTAALVAQHIPSADNALEAEVAALLEQAGAANTEAIEEAEEQLALKALSLEEARERRERLAKMRSLLFYHELKSRRLKAIKSKEYHRHLARASKRKATKLAEATAAAGAEGGSGDVDAERVEAIEAEFQRAKERLTLRHRNSSRWARRALKRGQLQVDEGTKAALAEQLQLGQQLRRKIEGRKGSGSDEDGSGGSTSASDSEGEGAKEGAANNRNGGRLRSAALELLAGGGPLDGAEAPKKGLLALPFMKRALEKRRLEAQQDAQQLLRELEEQEHQQQQEQGQEEEEDDRAGGNVGQPGNLLEALVGYGVPTTVASGVAGRRKFGAGADVPSAAAADADADAAGVDSDLDSDDAEDAEAKAERLGRQTRDAAATSAAARKQQQQQQAAAGGKKGAKGKGKAEQAPPSAADQADLDAAVRAGAAGRGLLVSSADAGLDLPVSSVADEADAERRESGRAASTRGGGVMAAARGVLAAVAAQQGSVGPGGGRAALFEAQGGAAGAAAAEQQSFVASKKFAGSRPGYVFKKGPQGLGYYLDGKAAAAAAAKAKAAPGGKQQPQQGKGKAEAAAEAEAGVKVAGQDAKQGKAGKQQPQVKEGKGAQPKAAAAADAAPAAAAAADGSDDEDNGPVMRPVTGGQRDLIRQAFAGDDVEAEFASEKAAAVAEELPQIEEPSALPGWGAWSGQQRNPKWMQTAKEKAAKQRAEAAAGRKDAQLKYVVISEKWDKKATKYTAPAAPFPFTSQEAYERSLRQPLGREYNPDAAFRDLTRPAVLKQAGVAIAPLRYSEPIAKELGKRGKKAAAERESVKVVTVAGGMPRRNKRG